MKILKFETKDHPILGDSSLDFSRDGVFSDVVLIAGSNGSGKTTILNEIFDFLTNISPKNQTHNISITFELSIDEIDTLHSIENGIDHILKIESAKPRIAGQSDWGQILTSNSSGQINNNFVRSDAFQAFLKVVYSTVEINFANSQINSTTAKDIDTDKIPKEKSTGNISQEIKQLLVDIKSLDNQDAADWVESNHGQTVQVAKSSKRIERFKRAFDAMIEGKTFEGVKNEDNHKKVYFKDTFNNEIDISSLSSGEKQIVFRAGYLLKNIGTLSGGFVLIDEPEISFHPSWQEKYITFIKKLFSDEQGSIQSQIIIATHSPFIIQNENITDEKIVILEKSGKNTIESSSPVFYGYKKPEPVFIPIKIETKPLLLVEGESDKRIISNAWNRIYPSTDMYFDIKWAGEPGVGGAGLLNRHLVALQQHATKKVLGLFDADGKGLNEFNGTRTKNSTNEFSINRTIPSLKILHKVGATYLPLPTFRQDYFQLNYPQFSLLTLELFFADTILTSLGILETTPVILGSVQLVKIKNNHNISDVQLSGLQDTDFSEFKTLFEHIQNCFNQLP